MADAPDAPRALRVRMFTLTWLSYSAFYFARTNFSIVKKKIEDLGLGTKADFAIVDTFYLISYAVGQFVWGFTADTISPRKLLAFGMLGTAALAFAAGLSGTLGVIVIAFGLNGLTQSTGWPGNGRVMASWFGTKERGAILGYWGTCYQLGPLAAGLFAGYLLVHYGWQAAFIGPAIWVTVVALAIILLLRDRPSDAGYADPDRAVFVDAAATRAARRAAWKAMVRRPTVWLLGANYFCTKFIRYALLFWLPYYFGTQLDYAGDTAAYMSRSFEAGGVIGVVLGGLLADRMFKRRRVAVAAVSMLLLSVGIYMYSLIGATSMPVNFTIMAFVGMFLFSSDSLVSGAAAQDAGGPEAAAAACGFINGLGSIGAVAQSLLLVPIVNAWGWDGLFWVFIALSLIAVLVLVPIWRVRPE